MLIIDCKKFNSLDQAIKSLKYKISKTNMIKELRDRKSYEKPSVGKRKELLTAKHRQKLSDLNKK